MTKTVERHDEAEQALSPKMDLPSAAKRALAEAAARRAAGEALKVKEEHLNVKELGGPRGGEPTRYGDWERGGRAVDF